MKTIKIDDVKFRDICSRYDYEYGQIQIFGDGAEAVADLTESVLYEITQMIEQALEKAED
jgi:hypothetical protein